MDTMGSYTCISCRDGMRVTVAVMAVASETERYCMDMDSMKGKMDAESCLPL